MTEQGLDRLCSQYYGCKDDSDSTRSCRWTTASRSNEGWEMPLVEGPRIARNRKLPPWIIDEEKEWEVEDLLREETDGEEAWRTKMNSLDTNDIYPVVSLMTKPPLPKDFRKDCCEDDLEEWASQPQREREAAEGKLTFLLLRRGLSDFDYSSYGFTRLDLSQNALSDISLFLYLPSTFPSLKQLDLSYNKLTDISPLSALSTITHLDVSHNKLKDLLFMYPEWYWNVDEPQSKTADSAWKTLAQLSSMGWALCGPATSPLQWVNYSHNLVTKLGGERHWSHYPRLAYLNLSHNRISDTRSEGRLQGQQQPNSERSSAESGLAKLNVLHTLDLSHNHIRRVEGLNGVKAHKLVLTGNSICSWEETPPKKRQEQLSDTEVLTTEELSRRSEKGQLPGGEPKQEGEPSGAADTKVIRNTEREEKKDNGGEPSGEEPTIIIRKIGKEERMKQEKMEEKVEEKVHERKDSMESRKDLKIIYRRNKVKEVKKTPLDVLYRKPEAQWSGRESVQEDNDVLKAWLQEDNIFRNWYDTDMKLIHYSGRADYSEESNNDSSVEGRIPFDKPLPAKHSDYSASDCKVLFERSLEISTEESGTTFERVSEEWKDSEVHVLFEGLEIQGDDGVNDDYEQETVKCQKKEENRLLYMRGEVPYEENKQHTDELLETLFVRGSSDHHSDRQLYDLKASGGTPEVPEVEDSSSDAVENVHEPVEVAVELLVDGEEESKLLGGDVIECGGVLESTTNLRKERWWDVYKKVSSSSEEDSFLDLETRKAEKTEILNESEDSIAVNETVVEVPNRLEDPIVPQAKSESPLEIRVGLRSLLYLDELHLENNCISSLRMFQGMYCLSSLFIQNNQIEEIGELIFLNDLRHLQHLDMTGNPVAQCNDLEDLAYLLLPSLKSLNGIDLSTSAEALRAKPIKMCWKNPFFRASRQYDDLLLWKELLQKNRSSWHSPEIEYMDRLGAPYPVLLLVGPQGFWKESLCRHICKIFPEEVYVSPLCSTDDWLTKEEVVYSCRYVSKEQFFSMLRLGELVSASQDGFSFLGLEKRQLDEAERKGKVLVSAVDLESALVLRGSGFGGAPRLVLVLPGKRQEEEMLEKWRRRKGKAVTGIEEWEEELRREWAESQEEYLNAHHQNPGLFEFGLIYEGDSDTLGQIKNLVLEMLHEKAKPSSFDIREKAASFHLVGVSESMMKLIDKRLKKELNPTVEIW